MNTLRFDDKVAIVTGAGRGLGREYARMLASRGAKVIVNDLGHGPDGSVTNENPAQEVAEQINAAGGIAISNHDSVVSDAAHIVATAMDTFGRLDILITHKSVI